MDPQLKLIFRYFPALDPIQKSRLEQLKGLYEDWNAKVNVISRKDMDNFYLKHVLHSLAIGSVHTFKKHEKVLDLGTGGGFPGIPLAILFPETQFFLIDSIAKKIRVVQAVADSLKLDNVVARQARVEKISDRFDHVVTRAVKPLPQLLDWLKGKIRKKDHNQPSLIALKGGDLSEELAAAKHRGTVYAIKDLFEEDFFETKKIVIHYFDSDI